MSCSWVVPKGDPTRKIHVSSLTPHVMKELHAIMAEFEPNLTKKDRIFRLNDDPFCFLQFCTAENCSKAFNWFIENTRFRVQRPRDYVEPKIIKENILETKIIMSESAWPTIKDIGGEILLPSDSAAPSPARLLKTAWGSKDLIQKLHKERTAEEENIAAWEAYDRACALAVEEEKKRQQKIEWAAGASARLEAARLAAIEAAAEEARLEVVRAEKAAKARAKEERKMAANFESVEASLAKEEEEKQQFILNARNYLWYKNLPSEERSTIRQTHFSYVAQWATAFNYVREKSIPIKIM